MTRITVLAQPTRVTSVEGGDPGTTVAEGTPVRNLSRRRKDYVFEYANGIHWLVAFTSARPETKKVDAE